MNQQKIWACIRFLPSTRAITAEEIVQCWMEGFIENGTTDLEDLKKVSVAGGVSESDFDTIINALIECKYIKVEYGVIISTYEDIGQPVLD